ncbi:tetratricopeptide repeat protein [Flavobacterium sp. UBA6135]|uniref:tetratricopeptide repeat protein n=1 Tax=Flavobacterium sp. UBA6135 TaxID=1946553 RepID=UPI0025C2B438|nr:tetratricopeptide repeat protein [Flavobacterium sp. UBA6135]
MKIAFNFSLIIILFFFSGNAQTSYESYFRSGNFKLDKNEFKEAIIEYSNAISINKESYEVYYNRGIAYLAIESFDLAIQDFTQTLKLNPNYTEAFGNRGLAYFGLKNIMKH